MSDAPERIWHYADVLRKQQEGQIVMVGDTEYVRADIIARIRAEERERLRHMLGAMILAVEEDCDDEAEFAIWFAHWMKKGAPNDEPHYGDCTKVAMSCHRCLWDRVFSEVDAALRAMGDE